MSVATLTKTRRPRLAPAESEARPTEAILTHRAVAEAPDAGAAEHEAPETRVTRHAEAPDAGESRGGHDDDSHGRSRS